jgi:hypothetical protein
MSAPIDVEAAVAAYLFADPDDMKNAPTINGLPAAIDGIRRRWPEASYDEVAGGIDLAARLLRAHGVTLLGEAGALDAMAEATIPTSHARQ